MDPVTIIGIAGSVVQFVSFAFQLISKTKDIHESAGRQAKEIAKLDEVYNHLLALSSKLESSSKPDPSLELNGADDEAAKTIAKHVFAINNLSRACEADCQKLLHVVKKLQTVGGSGGKWGSFRAAVATMMKSSELEDLEDRLQKTQTTLTLHICSLTTFWHGVFDRQLRELRKENLALDARQSAKLDNIANALEEIKARVAAARSPTQFDGFAPDDVSALGDQMSRLSLFKEAAEKEHLILKSLSFDSRPVRHGSIPDAYSRTFEWAFQIQEETESGLLNWLISGRNIFWVSGKPGSGKSTFMKFLADHQKTKEALIRWAARNRLVIASHYFWSAGTPLQKSRQGLLQTLLYDIFRQLPDLIESACVERWLQTPEQLGHESWVLPELQRVLQRIADQDMEVKFCFFIDGLDEFEGDHVDFCRSLLDLTNSPHIKLCISSRAWNVFEDSFGRSQESKLYIHELTHGDIRSYAERRLQEHPRWKDLDEEVSNAEWLIDQIAERAAGVFLWVFLVTGQLRNGLTEYDSFSDLKRRLERVPDDLEAFFKHILESVEPFYHEKMATTLLISLEATEPAPIAIYGFHDTEYEDDTYALKLPLQPLPKATTAAKKQQITRRLSARCRGLLEVTKHGSKVEFLHRSVLDFLRTKDMLAFLSKKAPPTFNAHVSLIRAFTAYIKTTRFPQSIERTYFAEHTPSPLTSALREIMAHAKILDSDSEHKEELHLILDELDRCIPEMERKSQLRMNALGDNTNTAILVFRELLLDSYLTGYLNHRLLLDPEFFKPFKGPVLSNFVAILMGRCADPTLDFWDVERMMTCLLENGCSPNEEYLSKQQNTGLATDLVRTPWKGVKRTPWQDLVAWPGSKCANTCCRDIAAKQREARRAVLERVLVMMLEHGADSAVWPGEGVKVEEGILGARVALMMGMGPGPGQKRRSDSSDDSDSKGGKSKSRRRS